MKFPRMSRTTLGAAAALILSATAAYSAPAACDVAKAAHLDSVTGGVEKYMQLFDMEKHDIHASMCAYESKAGKHFGLMITFPTKPDGPTVAHQMDTQIHKIHRRHPDAKITHPKIGDAAVWDPVGHQLTVWLKKGSIGIYSMGDKTSPDLKTHEAIVKKVLAEIQK